MYRRFFEEAWKTSWWPAIAAPDWTWEGLRFCVPPYHVAEESSTSTPGVYCRRRVVFVKNRSEAQYGPWPIPPVKQHMRSPGFYLDGTYVRSNPVLKPYTKCCWIAYSHRRSFHGYSSNSAYLNDPQSKQIWIGTTRLKAGTSFSTYSRPFGGFCTRAPEPGATGHVEPAAQPQRAGGPPVAGR